VPAAPRRGQRLVLTLPRYVHANYRFIVDPRANYHAQSVDADVHLDWSNVLQILVSSQSQAPSCPICLSAPVAPRMAKCGHIFCLPCLMRFMHSGDGNTHVPEKKARSKKCPICFDTIYISETRPVRLYTGQEGEPPREGSDIVLRLVVRSAGSTLALPRDGAESLPKDEEIPWYFAAEVMDYARIMRGTEEYMTSQLEGDIKALELQEKEDELMFGGETAEWIQKAIRMLNEAKEKLKGMGGPSSAAAVPSPPKPKRPPIEFTIASDTPEMYSIQHAARSGQSISEKSGTASPPTPASKVVTEHLPTSDKPMFISSSLAANALPYSQHGLRFNHKHGSHGSSEYYFYQALLHYYLSPLDIRILREAFGNFASFPATILPRVEHVSTGHVVDDELRRRTKYLTHLPYGCEVNFLECDWTDTVPTEVLEKFKPEIERRRKRNQDKELQEEKARIAAEKEEEKRYAHLRRRRPEVEVEVERPFSDSDFQPLIAREVADNTESAEGDGASGTSPPWPQRQGSSFASLASISTSPSASRTVWGTAAVPPSSPPLVAAPQEHDPSDDGWLQNWEKDLLQEEDLIAQAQVLSLGGGDGSRATATSGGGKKKKKKITLMSTNVRRGA
jgi:Zinc finger, C3HC4 type (RING finger)